MRPFSQCLWLLDNLQDMPQLHQCLTGTGASSRFWLPYWTLKKHSHPSLCLAAALLHAGGSLHFMGRTSREVSKSDTLSCWKPKGIAKFFASLSLFMSNVSAPNGNSGKNIVSQCFPILLPHQVDFLPSHIDALCTVSQPYQEGQGALLMLNFKAFHSHLWDR